MTIFGTLWPKQNNPVIWLRHNGENKYLATPLSMHFLDMLVMDLFPIYFTQNHYFCFYFLTLAFYFVPSLGKLPTTQLSQRESGVLVLPMLHVSPAQSVLTVGWRWLTGWRPCSRRRLSVGARSTERPPAGGIAERAVTLQRRPCHSQSGKSH